MTNPAKVALFQMTSGIDPLANADAIVGAARKAADEGAAMLFTPEMCGLLDRDRARATRHIVTEAGNPVLAAARSAARDLGLWIDLGSLAVLRDDGKWANRGFIIDADGEIAARYDKIHMFDVDLGGGEKYVESAVFAAGAQAVTVDLPWGCLGLSICYDLRFPHLFRHLAQAGAHFLTVPAAFTRRTGEAHWHVLQRARAIETGCFVFAPAQTGTHVGGRQTYGHALIINPWGEVLADAGTEPGFICAEIDPAQVASARGRVPAITRDTTFAPANVPAAAQ